MRILVTGVAGFIGFAVARALLKRGDTVVGLDNLNAYYSPELKEARLSLLKSFAGFSFHKDDLADPAPWTLGANQSFDAVIHLAAQAGVRHSISHPEAYVHSNLIGFANLLEWVRRNSVKHLVFASTSSVYGLGRELPYREDMDTDHPMSFYSATKKANEVMAHSYAHLYDIPVTGLRFFTVYGPWGRPDMALFKFTRAIIEDKPLPVFNEGRMIRDFTFIDDIVEGVIRIVACPPKRDPNWNALDPDSGTSSAPFKLFNIGNNKRVELMRYIHAIENALGKKAKLDLLPMQAGDVEATEADVTRLKEAVGFQPDTPIEVGVTRFVEWYLEYHGADSKSAAQLPQA